MPTGRATARPRRRRETRSRPGPLYGAPLRLTVTCAYAVRALAFLARRWGGPVGTLRGWEGDRGFPGLPAALRLAGALGVPVERFAEGVEDPEEEEPGEAPENCSRRPRKRNAR